MVAMDKVLPPTDWNTMRADTERAYVMYTKLALKANIADEEGIERDEWHCMEQHERQAVFMDLRRRIDTIERAKVEPNWGAW